MKISSEHVNRHSEDEFAIRLKILSDSGAGIIHIRTQEVVRACMASRQAVLLGGHEYREWDTVNGVTPYKISNMSKSGVKSDKETDIDVVMANVADELKDKEREKYLYISFINPHYWLDDNPTLTHFLEQYNEMLPPSRVRILLITPDVPLPDSINDLIVTLPFDPPSHSELVEYLHNVVEGVEGWEDDEGSVELNEEDYDNICHVGAGMSKAGFEMYSSLAIVEAAAGMDSGVITAKDITKGINQGKTEIVNKNDILELYQPEDMKDVGGMENLKEWVAKRAGCYSDEASEFGIESPRGLVFVGIPGVGKSLAAKAIANEFGVPLIRLDFGKMFNSFVGKSEERMRTALSMIEAMAPVCVLAETRISLSDGHTISIESMYEGLLLGETYTLLGVDPENGSLLNLSMSTIIRSKGKDMVRIHTEKGSIGVTLDHKMLVERDGANVWVKARELEEGENLIEY